MTELGYLDYEERLSDVWGYTAPDQKEFALVGVFNGLSIVDISDASNPEEVAFIPGPESIWRDIKTWDHYAYCMNETGGGLLIVDLSNLPDISWQRIQPQYANLDSLNSSHNIFIDDSGFLYITGSNINIGETLILDLNDNPEAPEFVSLIDNQYSHDVYVRGARLYNSNIYNGFFSIYNISDRSNPFLINTQQTPLKFTHNAWLSDDGNTLFTTDERPEGTVAAYDITNEENIRFLDEYLPPYSDGNGVVVHNVHTLNDFIVTSWYKNGIVILDGSRPENLVEVAQYDFSPDETAGCWGAYPFFTSGKIIGTDIETGLYILSTDLKRACFLEGTITDANDGSAIFNTKIEIKNTLIQEKSSVTGRYKTGVADAGLYEVTYSLPGYEPEIRMLELENGQVKIEDVAFQPLFDRGSFSAEIKGNNCQPLSKINIRLKNEYFTYNFETNFNGKILPENIFEGTYEMTVLNWGFEFYKKEIHIHSNQNNIINFTLNESWEDPFNEDMGWAASGWQRKIPNADDTDAVPKTDSPNDPDTWLMSAPFSYNRTAVLTSPEFDLTGYDAPELLLDIWLNLPNHPDSEWPVFRIKILENNEEQLLVRLSDYESYGFPDAFEDYRLDLSEYKGKTNLRLRFELSNPANDPVGSAAIDNFKIRNKTYPYIKTRNCETQSNKIHTIYPNPSSEQIILSYSTAQPNANLFLFNVLGQSMGTVDLPSLGGDVEVNIDHLIPGVYFFFLESEGEFLDGYKFIKY